MNLKNIYISIFVVMTIMTAMLMSSVIHLSQQKKKNLAAIARLNNEVDRLQKNLDKYEQEKEKFDFYAFKDNVFNLKYPDFAQVARIVYTKSKEYGFSPYLVMALIQVESNFDQYAVSSAGACGLMQVNYSVWQNTLNIDYNKLFEKEYNIDMGLKVLKHYYEKTSGNLFQALFHYNNGYKYNNVDYTAKVINTKFFTQDPGEAEKKDSGNVSI
jgi:soluble lytic murein transglycosylase-like protein